MLSAIIVPALIGFGVLAVDVGHFYTLKTKMQQASDLAALSILTRMRNEERLHGLSASDAATKYEKVTATLANQNMPHHAKSKAVEAKDITFGNWDFTKQIFSTDPAIRPTNAVRIEAEMSANRGNPATTLFGKIFTSHVDVSVKSIAVLPLPKSFLMLSPDAEHALVFRGAADIDTETIHVNSTSDTAFVAPIYQHKAGVHSVHVTGGLTGPSSDKYFTGEDVAADFLKDVPAVDYEDWPCLPNPNLSGGGTHTLEGGRYCSGITISDVDEVIFEKGETFVIEGGPLDVDASMNDKPINGQEVLIYLADETAEARIAGANLSLTAKQSGPHAGIAIMTAPGLSPAPNVILDRAKLYFAGIFYAPNSNVISSNGTIDGACGYVCFVASTLDLDGTRVDVSPGKIGDLDPFGNTAQAPVYPPTLMKNFRPYILNKSAETGS